MIIVTPFILTIDGSFQDESKLNKGDFKLISDEPTLENYADLLLSTKGTESFRGNLVNSFKVGLGVCLLSIFIAVLGAYSLSHFEFRGKDVIARSMLFLYVFPTILMISPIYGLLAGYEADRYPLGIDISSYDIGSAFLYLAAQVVL